MVAKKSLKQFKTIPNEKEPKNFIQTHQKIIVWPDFKKPALILVDYNKLECLKLKTSILLIVIDKQRLYKNMVL